MVIPNFSKNINPDTEEIFWRMLTSDKKFGRLKFPELDRLPNINSGNILGRIVGGNLAVLTSLIGTGFLPDLKNKILLLEDISEPPYKIDRMLNQLRLNKVFKKVKGIILGSFVDCTESNEKKKTLTLEDIWSDYFSNINIPVIHSFPHGHINDFITVPIGIKIKLNATKGYVEFSESGVR
jgi:muramoyltetrapeptide carboxypeptidase